MSSNTINVDLNLRSNLRQGTADAQGLNGQLSEATRNLIAYNRAAAIGGSSARDFGKEAEGLGGVVRSYAIVAANIYAVTAAMKVLSDAMDTSIMVKSMDILGARSGMALGSLAKELVKASDGALSLRESLEVVSKGTTAGMSSAQLKDLTKVAGNASRALGLNMTDAMSRLIRGTSKLEPELLDELGLFTKIEPAVNEYARSLGKSAASLTDFERRQAFLTATLKEGADKYGDLSEAGTNAYTVLAAVFKNTLQTTLEKINDLLVPIIKLLSSSPTAFYGLLLGIGALLAKQILPALGQFNAGLQRSLNTASIDAIDRVNRIQKVISDKTARATAQATAQAIAASDAEAAAKIDAVDRVEKKLKSVQRRGGALAPGVRALMDQPEPATGVSQEQAKQLRREVKESKFFGTDRTDRRVQYEYIKSLEQSRIAEEKHAAAVQSRQSQFLAANLAAQKSSQVLRAEEVLQNRAIQKSVEQLNLANVARNTQEVGFIEATKRGLEDIRQRRQGVVTRQLPTGELDASGEAITRTVTAPQLAGKLGAISAGFQTIKVGAVAATRAVSTFLAVASPYLMLFALLAPAIGMLHDKMVGNIKDIEATNEAYGKLEEGIKGAYKTIEFLGKNSNKVLSVDNLNAAAAALKTVGDDLEDFTRKAQRELTTGKESKWYSAVEWVQNFVGFGTEKSISKALLQSFDAAVQLTITDSEPMRKELAKILQLPEDATLASIRLAASQADADMQMKLAQGVKQVGVNAKAAIQPTKELMNSLSQTAKVFDNIITSVLPSSGLAKWAYEGIINMQSFRKEIGNTVNDIGALAEIVATPGELIKKFGIEGSAAILKLIPQIKSLNTGYQETINKLIDVEKAAVGPTESSIAALKVDLENARLTLSALPTQMPGEKDDALSGSRAAAKNNVARAEGELKKLIDKRNAALAASTERQSLLGTKAKYEADIRAIFNKFDEISAISAIEFAKRFEIELGSSIAKAQLAIRKTIVGYIQDPSVKAEFEFDITKKELALEMDKLRATSALITAMAKNSIAVDRLTNQMKIEGISKLPESEQAAARNKAAITTQELKFREEDLVSSNPAKTMQRLIKQGTGSAAAAITPAATAPAATVPTQKKGLFDRVIEAVTGKDKKPEPVAPSDILTPSDIQAARNRATAASLPVLAQLQAVKAGENAVKAQQEQAVIKLQIEQINAAYNKTATDQENNLNKLKTTRKALETDQLSEIDRLEQINSIDMQIIEAERTKNILTKQRDVAAAQLLVNVSTPQDRTRTETNLKTAKELLATAEAQTAEEAKNSKTQANKTAALDRVSAIYKQINHELQIQSTLLESNRKLEDAGIESAKLKLDAEISIGKYTPQQIQDKRAAQALDEAELTMARELKNIEDARKKDREKYAEEFNRAAITYGRNSIEATRITETAQTAEQVANNNIESVKKLNAAKRESIAITNSLSVQEKGFAEIFTKGFEDMADAMADFVKTGKIDFKGLISSMIMELIRFQLRSQMLEIAGSGGGANFFAKLLSSALGSGKTTTPTTAPTPTSIPFESPITYTAKGAAYDSGIKKFAMGGAFTNSIVNSPTLFKFAKGTGMMGEAGPEAIMPLKRDASGTLGVRGGSQGNVDIVVNNYSGQKAETRETTDSRGNRKVEVVVGEMSAGDISKPGSSSQQALRSNYGLQPALIRR